MSSLVQWRHFSFFELQQQSGSEVVDSAHLTHLLKTLDVTCASHGRGHLVLGDAMGFVHLVDRSLLVSSFPSHEKSVSHLYQWKQRNLLLSIGYDSDPFPIVKIWDLDKSDRNKNPLCLRTVKIQYHGQPYPITALAVTETMSYLAFGLANGAVVLIKGDISRDRFTRQRVLHEERPKLTSSAATTTATTTQKDTPVTGLGFRELEEEPGAILYITTEAGTLGYWLGSPNGGRDVCEFLDDLGCPSHCAVVNDRQEMAVCREEAVYFFRPDGRGPCAILGGGKHAVWWYRSYLVVAGYLDGGDLAAQESATNLTIYDLKNKFIAFRADLHAEIAHVVHEWGLLFVFTKDKKVYQLTEKDTASKLDTLFKKNLYPLAIKLAHHQQLDQSSMVDIFRRYGDHLYAKGDFDGAMQQFLSTVGRLEPSYVVRKFLDAQRLPHLTLYLQTLHEKGLATADHTTLLLNCYTKSRDIEKLDKFIKTDEDVQFDVETAINVCRSAGFFEHATFLARKYHENEMYIRIQIEDLQNYKEALRYIQELEGTWAERSMKKYGKALIGHLPEESTALLHRLCTRTGSTQSRPETFIHIYVNERQWLQYFLEKMVQEFPQSSSEMVWNTLLELYLAKAQKDSSGEDAVMSLLQNPDAAYQSDHALVLAQQYQHQGATLFLYEKLKRYLDLLQLHMDERDHVTVYACGKRYGDKDPSLWPPILAYFASQPDAQKQLEETLTHVVENEIISTLRVVQILSKNAQLSLELVKPFILKQIQSQTEEMEADRAMMQTYREETEKMRAEIQELKQPIAKFSVTKCTACSLALEVPAIHFLCKHSYHIRCLGERERECPKCAPEHRFVTERQRTQEVSARQQDQFFRQLEGAEDGFGVIAEYFGRNAFSSSPAKGR